MEKSPGIEARLGTFSDQKKVLYSVTVVKSVNINLLIANAIRILLYHPQCLRG